VETGREIMGSCGVTGGIEGEETFGLESTSGRLTCWPGC
jgi:hypothetical protein